MRTNKGVQMKTTAEPQKKQPRCLAALDFEILCRLEGKEFAIRVFLMAIAMQKERELEAAYEPSRPRPMPIPPLIPMGSI